MDTEKVLVLWEQLGDFGQSETDQALRHCLTRLCEWTGADNAFWGGVVRIVQGERARSDKGRGWRLGAVQMLHLTPGSLERQKQSKKAIPPGDIDDTTRALMANVGRFRSHTLHDGKLVDLDAFRQTVQYDIFYRSVGIEDRMWVVFPVSEDAESFFCIDKFGQGNHFSGSDVELASFAIRGMKWFHRQLLLSHGLGICDKPLTSSERRVKQSLLTGASEKEIAKQLDLTPGTVHQYATRIYRKFGAKGRTEFMAMWMAGSPG